MFKICCGICNECWYVGNESTCTCPKESTWVGLTDVEWINIVNKNKAWFGHRPDEVAHEVAKLVEAKLKEKNT